MRDSFNYQKIFYHRPIFTRENLRLWSILGLVAFFTLLFVMNSLDWVNHIPVRVITSKVEKDYVAFLLKETPRESAKSAEIVKSTSPLAMSETPPETSAKQIQEAISKIPSKKQAATRTQNARALAKSILKYAIRPEEMSVEPITAAVEKAPGFTGFQEYSYRTEKPLSFRNEEKRVARGKPSINIPAPTFERFASKNGNRDLEETTAVMALNEHDIQFCFERFSRFDPSFSADVVVSFSIHPDGYVIPSSIKIIKSNIQDPRVLNCIKKSIQRWRNFPKIALEDGPFTITRKYIF